MNYLFMHNICNVILVFLAVLQKLSTNVRVSVSKQSMVCTYMYVWSYVIAIVIKTLTVVSHGAKKKQAYATNE